MTPVELTFASAGDGPPVVILHGLFGSKRNWQSVARALAESFRVVVVDLRNHGDSPHRAEMDYALMADDVTALLERLRLADAAVVGHSMGGKVAMRLALREGARIRHLVAVDIAPRAYTNEYGPMLDAMTALDMSSISRRSDADDALRGAIPDAAIRAFILQNLSFGRDQAPSWRLNLAAIASHIDELVGAVPGAPEMRFDGPSDFIRGARSDRVRDTDVAGIKRRFPAAVVSTVPEAGHWPHAENPAAFFRILRSTLTRHAR